MGIKTFAQLGYEAYGDEAGWKNHQGNPMPDWADLPANIQMYWHVAATAILRSVSSG